MSENYYNLAFYSTLALTILAETLIEAGYLFGYRQKVRYKKFVNPQKMVEASAAYAFIMGTGLDIMINSYGIQYDPDEIRSEFNERFNKRD